MRHVLLIDIDGLRFDTFQQAIDNNAIPNIQRMLGNSGETKALPLISTAPSITFCAQATIFTGAPPNQHGIAGNQFFDRFGKMTGKPRLYAFDAGDLLDFEDAVLVFSNGLASNCLQVPTIYEKLSQQGFSSMVVGNMYARGAIEWIKPTLVDLARLTKGSSLIGIKAPDYDRKLLENTKEYLEDNEFPNVLTYYLKGLDDESHRKGVESQLAYLRDEIDPHLSALWDFLTERFPEVVKDLEVILFSDHGQIDVTPDDRHSVRMAFPFQNEFGELFKQLGFDLTDYPGEGPRSNAVIALNGGMAHIYLRKEGDSWDQPADFLDITRTAKALWKASKYGTHAPDLQGSLDSILIRDTGKDGWSADYQAMSPEGELITLEAWATQNQSGQPTIQPVHRIKELTGEFSGDIILIANYLDGFYFSPVLQAVHGGMHPEDSTGILAAKDSEFLHELLYRMPGNQLWLKNVADLVFHHFEIG